MTPTPMTTREAVEQALYALAFRYDMALGSTKRKETVVAAQLLCELYGFKLEQFFGNGEENSKRASELSSAFYGFNGPEISGDLKHGANT